MTTVPFMGFAPAVQVVTPPPAQVFTPPAPRHAAQVAAVQPPADPTPPRRTLNPALEPVVRSPRGADLPPLRRAARGTGAPPILSAPIVHAPVARAPGIITAPSFAADEERTDEVPVLEEVDELDVDDLTYVEGM